MVTHKRSEYYEVMNSLAIYSESWPYMETALFAVDELFNDIRSTIYSNQEPNVKLSQMLEYVNNFQYPSNAPNLTLSLSIGNIRNLILSKSPLCFITEMQMKGIL